jgi:hypothetical protein
VLLLPLLLPLLLLLNLPAQADMPAFLEQHCLKCHDADTQKANLNFEALKADWCPVLVRDGEGVPRGNKELLKLGARALTAGQLAEIPNLAEWVRENTAAQVSEPELFDFVLRDKPR